jgi:hypothetical protein
MQAATLKLSPCPLPSRGGQRHAVRPATAPNPRLSCTRVQAVSKSYDFTLTVQGYGSTTNALFEGKAEANHVGVTDHTALNYRDNSFIIYRSFPNSGLSLPNQPTKPILGALVDIKSRKVMKLKFLGAMYGFKNGTGQVSTMIYYDNRIKFISAESSVSVAGSGKMIPAADRTFFIPRNKFQVESKFHGTTDVQVTSVSWHFQVVSDEKK